MGKGRSFEVFFDEWLDKLKAILHRLLRAPRDTGGDADGLRALVAAAVDQYRAYYTAKSELIRSDVTGVFSPPWLSSLERFTLWIGGWKPTLAFRLLASSGVRVTEGQAREAEEMRGWTRAEEAAVEEEMAKLQVGVAELAGTRKGCEAEAGTMRKLMEMAAGAAAAADRVRMAALGRAVRLLTPVQGVDYGGGGGDAATCAPARRDWSPRVRPLLSLHLRLVHVSAS